MRMKMEHKLTLLFSLLATLITLANSIYSLQFNMDLLHENAYNTLSALGNKMLTELESYQTLTDYAIEELTSNINFMNALRKATMNGADWSEQDLYAMQNLMYQVLYYEAPLTDNFYRITAFAPNGFYLSSRAERYSNITCMSEEAKALIESLDYLEEVRTTPSTQHTIGPHADPWTSLPTSPMVFFTIKAVQWHGRDIGYIEVDSPVEDLERIFTVDNITGVSAHALFDDGEVLYRAEGDTATYEDAEAGYITLYTLEDGSRRFAIRLHSNELGLSVYVAQDFQVYYSRAHQLQLRRLGFSGVILVAGIIITILMSKRLTRSIRSLTKKIRQISSRRMVDSTADVALSFVTSPRDEEIFTLEQTLNDLLTRLRNSAQREISLRNSTMQAQLNALQTQINPHFVYNTLNIISAKGMESGNEEIMEICDQFAQMLRYATDTSAKTAPLSAEVQNAQHYLMLAKARYEDQLEFYISMPENADDLLIPKLTLQPLVENAVSHGFKGQSGKRVIRLEGVVEGDQLRLVVRDNGSGFDEEVRSRLLAAFAKADRDKTPYSDPANGHIGLINTYLRLHYYSKGKLRMVLYNDGGAVVEMTLPREIRKA